MGLHMIRHVSRMVSLTLMLQDPADSLNFVLYPLSDSSNVVLSSWVSESFSDADELTTREVERYIGMTTDNLAIIEFRFFENPALEIELMRHRTSC